MRGADGLQGADGGGGGGGSSELPSQAGNANKVLLTNGAAATWEFVSLALSTTGILSLSRGGTGANSAAGARQALLPAASAGLPLVSDGISDASFATIAFGSATTGTVSLGRGGTGQTTALTAFAALAPAPGVAGRVMVSDGTVNWTASALAIADTTGTLALGRGGTGLTSSGAAGNVLRSNGAAWASAALGVADVSGAAPLAGPTFTGTVSVGAFTATGAAVSLSGATSVSVPNVALATDSDTSAANTAFVQAAITLAKNPAKIQELTDHFESPLFSSQLGWVAATNGAGALATTNSIALVGADGHRTLNAGTGSAGRASMSFEGTAGQLPLLSPWARGLYSQEWRVQVPVLSGAGTTDYEFGVCLGAGALTNNTSFASGFGLYFSGAAPVWQFASRSGGSAIASASTSVSVTAAAWIYLRIELDGGGATGARAYIGVDQASLVLVATITTVGATVLALGPMAKTSIIGTGNTARNLYVALFESKFTLNTAV